MVYAKNFKDYSILTEQQLRIIEDKIKAKAKVVYLHADPSIIKERLNVRGDEYIEGKDIDSILELYREAMSNAGLHTYSWDTGQWSSDEIVEDLIQLFE